MAELTLHSKHNLDVTIVSNQFIDRYMCDANGEFVKIYLYLLRCINDIPKGFSISFIADKINLTENDVLRALKYWEKARLLILDTDSSSNICSISLTDTAHISCSPEPASQDPLPEDTVSSGSDYMDIHDYVPESSSLFESDSAIQQVLFITEQYLGHPLSSTDTLRIYYFYDILQFPTDLIEYLVEYCVCNGNKSMRYIEKVALAWADKGIRTVAAAKDSSSSYHKDYFIILKAFGIRGRNPVNCEITYMSKWLNTYHFTTDIITEACNRTVQQVGNPSFPYADSILTNWHNKGIITQKDIKILDEAHYQQKNNTQKASPPAGTSSKSNNKFNNFDQRSYDYTELEKQLIQM